MKCSVKRIIKINNEISQIIFQTKENEILELYFYSEESIFDFINFLKEIVQSKVMGSGLMPMIHNEEETYFEPPLITILCNVKPGHIITFTEHLHEISLNISVTQGGDLQLVIGSDVMQSLYNALIIGGQLTLKEAQKFKKGQIVRLEEAEVVIYVPSKIGVVKQEKIVNACGEFMEALGFEIKTEDEPVLNSFWKRLQFVFKKNLTQEDADRLFNKGKQALELKLIDQHIADQTKSLASAAADILKSIENVPDVVIRAGALLVIKKEDKVIIHQLSSDEVYLLNKNPALVKESDPLTALQNMSKGLIIVPAVDKAEITDVTNVENISDHSDDKDDKKLGVGNPK